MQTIGVRELKSNLSKYLRRVEAGERLTVTDRGRAIALWFRLNARRRSTGHMRWWRAAERVDRWQAGRVEIEGAIAGKTDVAHGNRGSPMTVYLDTSNLVKLYVDEPDAA